MSDSYPLLEPGYFLLSWRRCRFLLLEDSGAVGSCGYLGRHRFVCLNWVALQSQPEFAPTLAEVVFHEMDHLMQKDFRAGAGSGGHLFGSPKEITALARGYAAKLMWRKVDVEAFDPPREDRYALYFRDRFCRGEDDGRMFFEKLRLFYRQFQRLALLAPEPFC